MITKQFFLEFLQGKADAKSILSEKAEGVTLDIAEQMAESLLVEMTPGHKEMMKQHLDNLDVVDDTPDDKDAKAKVKKRADGRIKNAKCDDDRDDYNELGDFDSVKGNKGPNFVGKKYTQNERALRTEGVVRDIVKSFKNMPKDIATATNWYGSGVNSYDDHHKRKAEKKLKNKAVSKDIASVKKD